MHNLSGFVIERSPEEKRVIVEKFLSYSRVGLPSDTLVKKMRTPKNASRQEERVEPSKRIVRITGNQYPESGWMSKIFKKKSNF